MGDDVEVLIVSRSPSAVIEADPGQLDQVLVNLAVNARDAMPRGGKFILETRTEKFDQAFAEQHQAMAAGKYVLLAVSDTGSGMDEEPCRTFSNPSSPPKRRAKELAWAWPPYMASSSRAPDTSWSTVNRDTERRSRSISPARITKSASHQIGSRGRRSETARDYDLARGRR